jgi:hypothetical protein
MGLFWIILAPPLFNNLLSFLAVGKQNPAYGLPGG